MKLLLLLLRGPRSPRLRRIIILIIIIIGGRYVRYIPAIPWGLVRCRDWISWRRRAFLPRRATALGFRRRYILWKPSRSLLLRAPCPAENSSWRFSARRRGTFSDSEFGSSRWAESPPAEDRRGLKTQPFKLINRNNHTINFVCECVWIYQGLRVWWCCWKQVEGSSFPFSLSRVWERERGKRESDESCGSVRVSGKGRGRECEDDAVIKYKWVALFLLVYIYIHFFI